MILNASTKLATGSKLALINFSGCFTKVKLVVVLQ
jgi:hypothetical protein